MSLSEQMQADAKEGQRVARKHFVIGLDFTVSGLAELDEAAGNVDDFMRGGASPENLAILVKTWGAYLGEVLCKEAGAEWVESDNAHGVLLKSAAGEMVSPHNRIQDRISQGDSHSLIEFAKSVQGAG